MGSERRRAAHGRCEMNRVSLEELMSEFAPAWVETTPEERAAMVGLGANAPIADIPPQAITADGRVTMTVRPEWWEQHRLDVDAEVQAYRNWRAVRAAGKKKAAAALRRRKNKIATASRRQQRRA